MEQLFTVETNGCIPQKLSDSICANAVCFFANQKKKKTNMLRLFTNDRWNVVFQHERRAVFLSGV